jgi:hypothetical protein
MTFGDLPYPTAIPSWPTPVQVVDQTDRLKEIVELLRKISSQLDDLKARSL